MEIQIYDFKPDRIRNISVLSASMIIIGSLMLFLFSTLFVPSETMRSMPVLLFFVLMIFGPILVLIISGTVYLEANTKITDNLYYSPSARPSIHKLKIDNKGIYLKLYETDSSGNRSHFTYDFVTIPYDAIHSIYPVIASSILNEEKRIVGLHIEINDKRIGYINFRLHRGHEVIRLLQKNFKNDWGNVYKQNQLISPIDSEHLQQISEVKSETG